MNEKNDSLLSFGNATTVVNSIIVIVAGYLFTLLVSIFGVGIPFTESQLASFLSALVFGGFAYINAKNHNTFWDNDKDTLNIPTGDLTKAQIRAIENFTEKCLENNSVSIGNRTYIIKPNDDEIVDGELSRLIEDIESDDSDEQE